MSQKRQYNKVCSTCKGKFVTTYRFAKKCDTCKAPVITTLGSDMKAPIRQLLSELTMLPYNKGYLQALVDSHKLEKVTLDTLVKWASRE